MTVPPVAAPGGPAGVNHNNPDPADEADDATVTTDDDATVTTDVPVDDEIDDDEAITPEDVTSDETINDTGHPYPTPTLPIPDVTLSGPTDPSEPAAITGVAQETIEEEGQGENTGVGQPGANTGVGTGSDTQSTEVDTTRTQQLHKMQLRHNKQSYEHRLTEFRQPLQVQSHLEMPRILVQLGHIQRT